MSHVDHFVTKSFYSGSKRYLNPLERKQIKDLKGSTVNEVIPLNKSTLHTNSPKVGNFKAGLSKPNKSPVSIKLSTDALPEIVLYKTNKSSPNKNMNRKFFRKRSPTKSPRKAHMTLDMGRSLQLKFSNVRRSPRKINISTNQICDNKINLESKLGNRDLLCQDNVRQSPRKVNQTLSSNFSNQIHDNDKNTLGNSDNVSAQKTVDKMESDAESGFSEDGSSTYSLTDTPPRTHILSGQNTLTPSPKHKIFLKRKSIRSQLQPLAKPKKANFEQLAIDAGQKDFGAVRCQTCNMVFTIREPHDEMAHSRFHNMFVNTLRFPGWKKEDLIKDFYDGRIIRVLPNMAKHQLQKVEELRQLIDTDLGFPNVGLMNPRETHFYLFIASDIKKIVGCIISEPIKKAYRVFQDPQASKGNIWCRAETPVPAVCGISRIWVVSSHQRMKIASRLLDNVALNFAYGSVIKKEQIAFSDPTPDGREFISSYAGTSSFLVYGGY
ncbi:N-acetyltransferase ESCO1 [Nymphon striatum]|nr:N-acetyltransferase ESCO1 [Nymphon striatum]